MKRKDFIKKFAVGGSILLSGSIILNSCSKDNQPEDEPGGSNPNEITIDLTDNKYADLGNIGGYVYTGDIIVFRTSDTGYSALSKLCTHSQCTITYNHTNSELPCPCHGSKFSTGGAVTNGPANANLKKYNVVKDGNILKIS